MVFLNLAMVAPHLDARPATSELSPRRHRADRGATVRGLRGRGHDRARVGGDAGPCRPGRSVAIDAHPLARPPRRRPRGGWRDDWRPVRRERPPVLVGETWTATVELEPDDQVHGLGERAAPLNLRPGTYGLWNTEQSGSYGPEADPLYITIPVHLVVGPGRGHLGFWENTHNGTVMIGETLSATFEGGALRTYVAPGPPDRALEQFHELTGRPALPPSGPSATTSAAGATRPKPTSARCWPGSASTTCPCRPSTSTSTTWTGTGSSPSTRRRSRTSPA